MKKQKEPNKLNEFLENERFKDEKKSWVEEQVEKFCLHLKEMAESEDYVTYLKNRSLVIPEDFGILKGLKISDGRGLMAHIKEIKPATKEEFGDWLKNALKSISERPIEPRQQMLNAWLLIAYPDDMFLSVFKSKKDDGIVYIGGAEVMHQIHKRLYELDQKLYIELYGMEAGEKFEFDEMSNLFVSEPKPIQDPNFPFDNMQVNMEPYNNLTMDKLMDAISVHKNEPMKSWWQCKTNGLVYKELKYENACEDPECTICFGIRKAYTTKYKDGKTK